MASSKRRDDLIELLQECGTVFIEVGITLEAIDKMISNDQRMLSALKETQAFCRVALEKLARAVPPPVELRGDSMYIVGIDTPLSPEHAEHVATSYGYESFANMVAQHDGLGDSATDPSQN